MKESGLTFDEIVFEDRNKLFGAYMLRKVYSNNLFIGFSFALLMFSVGLISPLIYNILNPEKAEEVVEIKEVNIDLMEAPPVEVKIPPLPKYSPPAPPIKTVRFVPPVVTPDEEVQTEEKIATEEELKTSIASTATNDKEEDYSEMTEVVSGSPFGEEEIFEQSSIEVWPEFNGGMNAMMKYLRKKIKYNRDAEENRIQGKVYVSFVIKKDGSISDVKILKGLGHGLDENAMVAVKNMPAWSPGKHNGRAVSVRFTLPVNYKISD